MLAKTLLLALLAAGAAISLRGQARHRPRLQAMTGSGATGDVASGIAAQQATSDSPNDAERLQADRASAANDPGGATLSPGSPAAQDARLFPEADHASEAGPSVDGTSDEPPIRPGLPDFARGA